MQILIISLLRDDQSSHGLISHIAWGTCASTAKNVNSSEDFECGQQDLAFKTFHELALVFTFDAEQYSRNYN